jgi:hypothetical protein
MNTCKINLSINLKNFLIGSVDTNKKKHLKQYLCVYIKNIKDTRDNERLKKRI